MKILVTKSDLVFSKLIRNITKEPASHIAVELDNGMVIHSSFFGVTMLPAKEFRSKCTVVREIVPTYPVTDASVLAVYDKYKHSGYDFGAFLFLGFSLLLREYAGLPMPKSNLWQSTGMFLCTEWGSKIVDEKEDSMITPWKLSEKYLASGLWAEVVL